MPAPSPPTPPPDSSPATPFLFYLTPPTPIKLRDPAAQPALPIDDEEYMDKSKRIDFEVSSTPAGETPLYPYPMERIKRPSGGQPPHVAWLGSTESLDRRIEGPTPWAATHRLNSPALARSMSSGGTNSQVYAQPMHRSTQSLPFYPQDSGESIPADARPLSPISEGLADPRASGSSAYLSIHEPSDDPAPSATPSSVAFLSRPVKRSGSFSSAKSLGLAGYSLATAPSDPTESSQITIVPHTQTTTSTPATLPIHNIPELDLKPSFKVTIPPRRNKSGPSTPHTFANSPLKHAGYSPAEDTSSWRTASFLTAPSIVSSQSSGSLGRSLRRSVVDEVEGATRGQVDVASGTSPKSTGIGTSNASGLSQPRESMHEFGALDDVERGLPIETVRRSTLSSITRSLREGARSVFQFGRDRSEFPERKPAQIEPACVLFWIGFIAPWTWLIGGWLLTDSKAMDTGGILPVYSQSKSSALIAQEKGKAPQLHNGSRLSVWNPIVAPSVVSLASSAASRGSQFTAGAVSRMKHRENPQVYMLSKWIRRCRIAAVFGIFVILICFIVAIVVVARQL